jgi:hypothetical protein
VFTGCESYSVVDPWHFGTDPDQRHFGTDPDQRIRTTDLRIRILLFSSVTFKMTTQIFFSLSLFGGVNLHHSSKISHKTIEIKVFLTNSLDDGRIRIQSRSGGNVRIREVHKDT